MVNGTIQGKGFYIFCPLELSQHFNWLSVFGANNCDKGKAAQVLFERTLQAKGFTITAVEDFNIRNLHASKYGTDRPSKSIHYDGLTSITHLAKCRVSTRDIAVRLHILVETIGNWGMIELCIEPMAERDLDSNLIALTDYIYNRDEAKCIVLDKSIQFGSTVLLSANEPLSILEIFWRIGNAVEMNPVSTAIGSNNQLSPHITRLSHFEVIMDNDATNVQRERAVERLYIAGEGTRLSDNDAPWLGDIDFSHTDKIPRCESTKSQLELLSTYSSNIFIQWRKGAIGRPSHYDDLIRAVRRTVKAFHVEYLITRLLYSFASEYRTTLKNQMDALKGIEDVQLRATKCTEFDDQIIALDAEVTCSRGFTRGPDEIVDNPWKDLVFRDFLYLMRDQARIVDLIDNAADAVALLRKQFESSRMCR